MKRRTKFWMRVAGAALLTGIAAMAVAAENASTGGCLVSCTAPPAAGDGYCTLTNTPRLPVGQQLSMSSCVHQTVEAGEVVVRFRVSKKLERFTAVGRKPFSEMLGKYAALDCMSFDTNCNGGAEAGSHRTFGKPFEADDAWKPKGTPCGQGLPCGMVSLAADPVRFRLVGAAQRGELRVKPVRGGGDATIVKVVDGTVAFAPGWLKPGTPYRYEFVGDGGQASAAGEFSTLSGRAQADIAAQLTSARAQPGASPASAFLDVMLANGLDWDALQLTLGMREAP